MLRNIFSIPLMLYAGMKMLLKRERYGMVERARLRNDRYDTPRETVEVSRLGARARNCLALDRHIDH